MKQIGGSMVVPRPPVNLTAEYRERMKMGAYPPSRPIPKKPAPPANLNGGTDLGDLLRRAKALEKVKASGRARVAPSDEEEMKYFETLIEEETKHGKLFKSRDLVEMGVLKESEDELPRGELVSSSRSLLSRILSWIF